MSVTAAASGFVVLLLTVPVVLSQSGWSVTYDALESKICAPRGSTVTIHCNYAYPLRHTPNRAVSESFWFIKDSIGVYVDLRTDPQYSGRVLYDCEKEEKKCTLIISDVRQSDSAEYKFRFTTNQPADSWTGSPGVTLSVADFQVQVRSSNQYSSHKELMCQSSCPLPHTLTYVWYNNQREIQRGPSPSYSSRFYYGDIVSCAVKDNERSRSPPMLVQSQNGWGVSYASTEICAFRGSTVDINCTYTYPGKLNNKARSFWFVKDPNVDLTTDPKYSGRVEYTCEDNKCCLRISDLRQSDSAEYKFRFITNQPADSWTGSPGVTLSVKDPQLQVHVRRSMNIQISNWTELTCHSSCQLPHHLSYVWYNKHNQVKGGKKYFLLEHVEAADSYYCAIKGHEHIRSASVCAPEVPVVSSPSGEIMEGSSVTLTCSSDAQPAANYTWYKKNEREEFQLLLEGTRFVFSSIQSSDSGVYHCTAENELGRNSTDIIIAVKYAPRSPSVSVSPTGEIVEGSSVSLTCSSDANPAANCTWYRNHTRIGEPKNIHHFTAISSGDRGVYHCKCENKHGRNSTSKSIDVLLSPSGEIVEGSSVNLTCSSDANPAANCTWYRNHTRIGEPKNIHHFTAISSGDRGVYHCKCENQYGHNSIMKSLDVLYAPKLPSVSVSPNGEIVEGSSVNLTCSSDANPPADYTWYKENEDSPKASEQIFNIADVRAEHGGNYLCAAQNIRGRHNSTVRLTVKAVSLGAWKSAVILITSGVFLGIILLFTFFLIRKMRTSKQSSQPGDRSDNSEKFPSNQSEEQRDFHSATVHFLKNQTDPIYSNIRPVGASGHEEDDDDDDEEEEDEVAYATVTFKSSDPRVQDTGEDPATLYSTVTKNF
ncbi:hemicentin-2 isoform X2 [Scophthalmus maximus]|uniref:hemicentin-2 isoform X2 n=1 Tax=Scophthalmus maximus TaxID=52904 RepID=UPI001FA8701C|nr:hemicentin-2 isoform X2 [Scophthalmus maximus]